MAKIFNTILFAFNYSSFAHALIWVAVLVVCVTLFLAYSKIMKLEVVKQFGHDVKFGFIKHGTNIFAMAFKATRNHFGIRVVGIVLVLISIAEFSLSCLNNYNERRSAQASA